MIKEKVFLLVGGLGTRLRSIISDIPKPMAPIDGKPFLWYKVMQLKSVGFKNFVFCSGYLSERIQEYFGIGEKWDINIEYSVEKEQMGTAGAIQYAKSFVNGPFFMCNGDCYLDFNPQQLIYQVQKNHAKYVILLTLPELKGAYGIVDLDKYNKVTQFIEKPPESHGKGLINAGVYYLSKDVLSYIPVGRPCSIEKEVFPKLVENKEPLYGAEYKGYFIDIGIPERYQRFCEDVKAKKINYN